MDFYEKNRQAWIDIQNKIFPTGIPKHCEWTKLKDIISVLNTIGSVDNSNHMFYPTGGGLDVESSKLSVENNCIEIFTGLTDILKPKRLTFESFADPIWNYFRIETSELEPSGVYKEKDYPSEELTEIETGKYINRSYWDEGKYQGQKLPKSARVLTRHLKGAFVIFAKSSYYNRNSSTYDARHNKMTSDEFREYIEKVIKNGW
ncbi:MAG: serine/threonine protein kinase [Bacteroidetes bacterium]|nr:serine/threonine protein kinase [Bacteroidota bacterium]